MTYVDSSVVLAYLLVEERRPAEAFWQTALIASRLPEYEVWCRLHGHGPSAVRSDAARELLARITMVELSPLVLARALEPFPRPVRSTLCTWRRSNSCASAGSCPSSQATTSA